MESWCYVSKGKGFVAEEAISPFNSLVRNKNAMLGWELKSPLAFGNNMLASSQQTVDIQGFAVCIEMTGKQAPGDSIFCEKTIDPNIAVAFSGDEESTTKLSSSVVDSSSQDLSLIDLKLGRFGDRGDVLGSKLSRGAPGLSSSGSSTPPRKRMRLSGVNSHTALCQVYGCNKDLSSSKDYHKRHKVCELHSKTAKVIVNGIEQRFCQQCSRFHLLAEFDDGKRSCRKRLAGHNERRRKPQVGNHSGRAGRMLQSDNDKRFEGITSFICHDILPSGLLHPEKHMNYWSRGIKVEEESDFWSPSIDLQSKLLFHRNAGKQLPSFPETRANAVTSSVFGDSSSQAHELGTPEPGPRSTFFHNSMFGCEDLNGFSAASTNEGFSGTTDSGCALSLLSSQQSHNSSIHLPDIPLARSFVNLGSQTSYSTSQVSGKLIGPSSQALLSVVPSNLPSSRMNLVNGSHFTCPIFLSKSGDAANFGSDFPNYKDCLSAKEGPTIDLLQLSSQLQRVEDQRQSLKMKQENVAFHCPRIT